MHLLLGVFGLIFTTYFNECISGHMSYKIGLDTNDTLSQHAAEHALGLTANKKEEWKLLVNVTSKTTLPELAQSLLNNDLGVLVEGIGNNKLTCAASLITMVTLLRAHSNSEEKIANFCKHSYQLHPGYKDYVDASVSLITKYGWTQITVIYEINRFDEVSYLNTRLAKSVRQLHSIAVNKSHKRSSDTYEAERIFKHIHRCAVKTEVILLFVSNSLTSTLLYKNSRCDLKAERTWIICGPFPMELKADDQHTVIGLRISRNDDKTTQLLSHLRVSTGKSLNDVKDHVLLMYDSVLIASHVIHAMTKANKWTNQSSFDAKINRRSQLQKYIQKINLQGTTGNLSFDSNRHRKNIKFDVINLRNQLGIKIGSYDSVKGLNMITYPRENIMKAHNPNSLKGLRLKIATAVTPPYVIKTSHPKNGEPIYTGSVIDLLNNISQHFKFTYDLYESTEYGVTRNGEWNGLIKELLEGRADMAAAGITIDQQRLKAVEFTSAYQYITIDLLLRKDLLINNGVDLYHFLTPWESTLWLGCLFATIVISIALFVVSYYSPYERAKTGSMSKCSLSECFWFSIECMLQQGPEHLPRSISARLLVSFFWMFILISLATYTANFTAFFNTQQDHSIKSLEEAYNQGFSFAIVNNSYLYSYFRDSDFAGHKKIWNRKIVFPSGEECVKAVREKNFVYFYDKPILDYQANKKPCDLTVVPGLTAPHELAFALRPGDPRVAMISVYILSLRESGFLRSMEHKWWGGSNECSGNKAFVQYQITLSKMSGVFVAIFVGMALSFFVLIIEILRDRRQRSRAQRIAREKSSE